MGQDLIIIIIIIKGECVLGLDCAVLEWFNVRIMVVKCEEDVC